MFVSTSNKSIKIPMKNIYISQVQYKSCGMTVVSSKKYLDYYISKRGKNIYGLGIDVLYGCQQNFTASKAVCLVGSSTLGLEGICGVNQYLVEENGNKHNDPAIGTCCYSYNIVERDFTHPDVKLGKFAMENRGKILYIGNVGAGVNARAGKLYKDWKKNNVHTGQGASYFSNEVMNCFCIVVLNSLGIIHEKGDLLHPFKVGSKEINHISELTKTPLFDTSVNANKPKNTTLTIFVTNIAYTEEEMKYISEKLHDVVESMVYPYGTALDGDTFFFVSTKEVKNSKENYLNDYKKTVREAIRSPFN